VVGRRGAEWQRSAVPIAKTSPRIGRRLTEVGNAMTQLDPWSYHAAWPPDARHVADARNFVGQHLYENGLSRRADVVRLVVSELATNAVLHAVTPFTVTLELGKGSLLLAVRDRSQASLFGPVAQPVTRPRGRGLSIVEALSSSWGVTAQADGKSVWALFALSGLDEAAGSAV
jgi:anti-sigma regulatory factor (Ser/Thr protein kinase)